MKRKNEVEYDGNFELNGKRIFFVINDDKKTPILMRSGTEKLTRYFNYFDESGCSLGGISVYDTGECLHNITNSYAKEKFLHFIKT